MNLNLSLGSAFVLLARRQSPLALPSAPGSKIALSHLLAPTLSLARPHTRLVLFPVRHNTLDGCRKTYGQIWP